MPPSFLRQSQRCLGQTYVYVCVNDSDPTGVQCRHIGSRDLDVWWVDLLSFVTDGVVTLVGGNLVFTPTANYAGTPRGHSRFILTAAKQGATVSCTATALA